MQRSWKVLLGTALGVLLIVAPATGQWTGGQNYYNAYDSSTLLQPPGGSGGPQMPQSYEAYWNNYLDKLQQQGGYYSITGNYPNSVPVTSYYPADTEGLASQAQASTGQSGMYSSASEYYGYGPWQYQQQGAQQYQQPTVQQYPSQYQQPTTTATQTQKRGPAKKRRLSMKKKQSARAKQAQPFEAQRSAWAQLHASYQQAPGSQQQAYQQQAYQQQYQQPTTYQQQPYPQPQYQQQAYQQPQYQQQAYQQPYQQQAYQQPQYQQQAYQQPYQQGAYPQQPVQAQEPPTQPFSSDPIVKEAQQKAYERALARQRAAELAAQQQAALQELQQTQRMYEAAQGKLQQQEARQRALQEEYHQKAVSDAYESLREAQRKYYELMGVSGESRGEAPPQMQASAPPMQYPQQQPQQYPQQMQGPTQQPRQPQGYPVSSLPQQPGTSYPAPPGQATPLHVQGQEPQSSSGGGFWAAVKEFLAPTTPVQRPTQSTFDEPMSTVR